MILRFVAAEPLRLCKVPPVGVGSLPFPRDHGSMGFLRYCRLFAIIGLGLLAASPASAQTAVDFKLFFESQPGDFIGAGQTKTYTQADGTVGITSSSTTVSVGIDGVS